MKNYLKTIMALCTLAGGMAVIGPQTNNAHAQTIRKVDCEIVYQGVTKLKGRCDHANIPGARAGSFGVGQDVPNKGYFASVIITGNGVGDAGYIEETPGLSLDTTAGEVRRNGACWSNDQIRICSTAITPPPAKGKAPPKKAVPR